jgi:hypothetical protein
MKRSARNLGGPVGSCFGKDLKQVGVTNHKEGEPMTFRESD